MYRSVIALILIWLTLSCGIKNQVDLEKDKQALLKIHQNDRQAHFDRDVYTLLQNSLDTFISVNNAQIKESLKEDRINLFKKNFEGATYSRWDNLEEPVVRISADGTLAWMITKLEIRRTKMNEKGERIPEGFIYAGIITYKKVKAKWMKEANVSTFEALTN